MSRSPVAEAKPYHHGDLSRALVDAARRLLESDGPSALSLRAVAREAGVSPAAPYHHFKDKSELLAAVAQQGWDLLEVCLVEAKAKTSSADQAVSELGVAYVCFARQHPALYRVMYNTARDEESLPHSTQQDKESAYSTVRKTLIEAGADPQAEVDLELATVAAWCLAHGLAEMAAFRQFEPLKEACGGQAAFFRAIFKHMALVPTPRRE